MNAPAGRWRSRAVCRGTDTALFYDLHPLVIAAAKALCARCAVRVECRADAEQRGEEFGVWGGLAADERPPPRPPSPQAGQPPSIGDDELYDLMAEADPNQPAVDQLLAHVWMPTATAYRTLERAVAMGVVERRRRGLYPTRR